MSKILSLTRWFKAEYEVGEDYVITMELKRLRFDEANRLLVLTTQAFGALSTAREDEKRPKGAPEPSLAEKVDQLSANAKAAELFYEALRPETMEWVWKDCVRNVCGIEAEDGPVTTGEGLKDFADQRLVMWILVKLQGASSLTGLEGKASSSPSTSGSEGPTSPDANGASPVTTTAAGAGSTTATAIQS